MVVNMADGLVTSQAVYSSNFTRMHSYDDYQQTNSKTTKSTFDEDDIHPINKPPVPSWRDEICSVTDPKLMLTPERSFKLKTNHIFSENNIPPLVTVSIHNAPQKQKQKVRFRIDGDDDDDHDESKENEKPQTINDPNVNLTVNSPKTTPKKEYCPKMYTSKGDEDFSCDNDLDVTQTEDETSSENSNSRSSSADISHPQPKSIKVNHSPSSSVEQRFTETALKYLTIRQSESPKQELPTIIDSVPAHVRKCHAVKNIVVTREFENKQTTNGYQFPFVDNSQSREPEHVLARPEYNTTLKISEELKDLKVTKPKVAQTLKQKLKESEEMRMDINEKASVKVNCFKYQFSGLVGVDPDINKLCMEVEREVTVKYKAKSSSKSAFTGNMSQSKVPDILEFYTDDRQREIPDLHLTGITMATENLSTADPTTAFDLYRHSKVWETLHN